MENTAVGARAPAVTLEAIGHKRKITIDAIGTPAVLIFVARETQDSATPVADTIRGKYPLVSQVVVANVADLRRFPRLFRKVAQTMMNRSYNEAVSRLDAGKAPEDYVLILPDWDGSVMVPLQISDVSKTIAAAVLDASGVVTGTYQGFDTSTRVLALIEQARAVR